MRRTPSGTAMPAARAVALVLLTRQLSEVWSEELKEPVMDGEVGADVSAVDVDVNVDEDEVEVDEDEDEDELATASWSKRVRMPFLMLAPLVRL